MPKKFWQFRNQAAGSAELLLYGDISDSSWWGDEVTPKTFADELNALGALTSLTVRINSGGGDVFAAQTIGNLLEQHTAQVTARIDGLCASAATIIACHCDKVVAANDSTYMIHPVRMGIFDFADAVTLQQYIGALNTIRENILNLYTKKTGREKDEVAAWMDATSWWTGEEAKTNQARLQRIQTHRYISRIILQLHRQQNHLTPRYTYRHQTAKRTDIIIRKSTMSNARIIEIPATRQIRSGKNNTMRKMRVAAYCRVSTEEEEQQGSFETQKLYYTEKINSTSEWELAGIYADDGISGIHTKKRDGFNQMIQDCKKKKIDLILTKSISRFARNTLDSIQYVRMLKAIGIAVIFEKENINTSTMNSEMILTVLSAFAQAESESISQNVARGKRMGFRQGKFPFPYGQILGYRKGLDGKPEVIPEEAEVIRMIFNSYLQGASLLTIKKKLEAGGVLTARGNKKWSSESVQRILQNEKYCGDVLLQKTFIEDVLTGVSKKNTGQLPQYYIENNHEGIVTKQMFREVQAEIARRNSKSAANQRKRHQGRYNSKYALSERLVCGDCGSPYKRVTWNIHGRKQIVWRCVNRLEYGTKFCSHSPSIPEEELHQAILKAVQNLAANFTDEVAAQLDGILRQMKAGENLKAQLQKQLEKAQQEFDRLLEMSLELDESTPFLDDKLRKLSGKIKILKANIAESTDGKGEDEEATKQLTAQDLLIKEYDDILTARIIEKVIVHSRQEIEIYFIGGYTQKIDLI